MFEIQLAEIENADINFFWQKHYMNTFFFLLSRESNSYYNKQTYDGVLKTSKPTRDAIKSLSAYFILQ